MQGLHGKLLIGGMALKDLQCYIDRDTGVKCKVWSGRLAASPAQREALEIGRTYRLELEDGRAGQLVLTKMHVERRQHDQQELVLEFKGTSELT